MFELFVMLFFIQYKHWYVDFVVQTPAEIASKGHYGTWLGTWHSIKHGIGTLLALILFVPVSWAAVAAVVDALVHYHIDWAKMRWGCQDINDPRFWKHLGLDQMAHQMTYACILIGVML